MKNNLVKSSTSIDKINEFSKSLGLKDNEKTVLEVVKSTDTTKLLNLRQGSYSNPEPWFIIDEDDKVHTILSIASLKDLLENVRELRKENFQSILSNNTVMALKLSKMFAKRIFDAKRRLLILQLNETDLRVYDCLLLLAELQNIPRDHYYEPQELNATINDIANWCGVKVNDVQKVLNSLVKTGKIDIRTNTIYVKNLKEIQRQIDLKRKKS